MSYGICQKDVAIALDLKMPFYSEPAVFAALLFAVHPIHCEAVAGVVGRADVLVAIAVLAGILLYYKTQSAAVAAICTVVAVCFKETGIMLPPLLVVFLLLKPSKVSRPSLDYGSAALPVSHLPVVSRFSCLVLSTARCPCPCNIQGVVFNA
ncbi:hypothetical protein COOONC_11638 [Cooperia oncophora]